MYQNIYNFTVSRMEELRSSSAQPAARPATFGEQVRQDAANTLIGLGNWIKPRSVQSQRSQNAVSLRRAGLAS